VMFFCVSSSFEQRAGFLLIKIYDNTVLNFRFVAACNMIKFVYFIQSLLTIHLLDEYSYKETRVSAQIVTPKLFTCFNLNLF